MKKSLMVVGIIVIAALGTGTYFIVKEKPEAQPLPTQLTVVPSESTVPWENSVILTATLTSNGNPVEGENISWSVSPYWWGVVVSPNHSITDSSGQASFSFTAHYLYPVAPREEITFTITASFAGNNRYQGSTENASVVVVWSPS